MSDIKQQVQQEIDEFGSKAHERFILTAHGFGEQNKNNGTLLHILEHDKYLQHHDIQLKPLPELFEHDVSFYGADAYLMWEISLSDKDKFIDATDNNDVLWALDSTNYDVIRKTSAALPFDLERAIAGDVVEINRLGKGWCFFKPYGYSINPDNNGNIEFYDASGYSTINPEKLRMKYPKAEK